MSLAQDSSFASAAAIQGMPTKRVPLLSYHFLKAIQGCARHSHLMSLTFKIKLQRNGAGI